MSIEDKVCVWKEIAINDDEKRKTDTGIPTLGKDKLCYTCDGKNENCKAYTLE